MLDNTLCTREPRRFLLQPPSDLIETWTMVKLDGNPPTMRESATLEIAKDGTYKSHTERKRKTHTIEGTYKLEGNKLTLFAKKGDKDVSEEFKIVSLAADTLSVLTTRAGKEHAIDFKKMDKSR